MGVRLGGSFVNVGVLGGSDGVLVAFGRDIWVAWVLSASPTGAWVVAAAETGSGWLKTRLLKTINSPAINSSAPQPTPHQKNGSGFERLAGGGVPWAIAWPGGGRG